MKRAKWVAAIAVFAFILTAAQASAAPITYSWWGYGSGVLGNSPFNNALVTFNYYADTDNTVFLGGGVAYNQAGTGTVTIDSIGSATFTDARMVAEWTTNTGYILLAYRDPGLNAVAIGVSGYDLPPWNFLTAVGPATGVSYSSEDARFATTAGDFYWSPRLPLLTEFTFQATTDGQIVPEPASVLLLGAGLGALALRKRRR